MDTKIISRKLYEIAKHYGVLVEFDPASQDFYFTSSPYKSNDLEGAKNEVIARWGIEPTFIPNRKADTADGRLGFRDTSYPVYKISRAHLLFDVPPGMVPGAYINSGRFSTGFGECVVTGVSEDGWVVNLRYEGTNLETGATIWVANSDLVDNCDVVRPPDDASLRVVALKGPYGED